MKLKFVVPVFALGLGILALACYTIIESQAGRHPLILPAQWMSTVLASLCVLFGMRPTVGAAACITIGYATLFVLATVGTFILPSFFSAMQEIPQVRQDFNRAPRWRQLVALSFPFFGVAACIVWLFMDWMPKDWATPGLYMSLLAGALLLLVGLYNRPAARST